MNTKKITEDLLLYYEKNKSFEKLDLKKEEYKKLISCMLGFYAKSLSYEFILLNKELNKELNLNDWKEIVKDLNSEIYAKNSLLDFFLMHTNISKKNLEYLELADDIKNMSFDDYFIKVKTNFFSTSNYINNKMYERLHFTQEDIKDILSIGSL